MISLFKKIALALSANKARREPPKNYKKLTNDFLELSLKNKKLTDSWFSLHKKKINQTLLLKRLLSSTHKLLALELVLSYIYLASIIFQLIDPIILTVLLIINVTRLAMLSSTIQAILFLFPLSTKT